MLHGDDDEDVDELDDEDEEDATARVVAAKARNIDILRYQDPIGEMQSGLHAAVEAKSREVAYLLLLLASNIDLQQFPAAVFQEAAALQIMRGDVEGKPDIRGLRDAQGQTAEELAVKVGGPWSDWIGKALLSL